MSEGMELPPSIASQLTPIETILSAPPTEQVLSQETSSPQPDIKPGLLRLAINKVKELFNSSQPNEQNNTADSLIQTQLSRRTLLKGAAGVALGAAVIAIEQKAAFASTPPHIPDITPSLNPSSPTIEAPRTTAETVKELRERTYNADPGPALSPTEQSEQDEQILERIFEGVQEMLNKKGLLTSSQVDENMLYPSYYLDNGGRVTGTNRGEFAQDSTLKWSRDYRPISKSGLRFNLPKARIPETLKNILPENPRSQENWRDIVKQFGLDNPDNTRYQPDEYTYCNFAARDMLRAFGVGDIPQWFKDFSTGELRETVTNIMFQQIKQYGTFNLEKYQQEGESAREWITVDKKGALEHAKEGKPVVLLVGRSTGVGHMGILNPDSTEEKLIVAQAGSKVGTAIEWDESHYSAENNYTDTMLLVHKLDFEKPSIG